MQDFSGTIVPVEKSPTDLEWLKALRATLEAVLSNSVKEDIVRELLKMRRHSGLAEYKAYVGHDELFIDKSATQ